METHVIRLLCEAYDSLEEAYREASNPKGKEHISKAMDLTRWACDAAMEQGND